MGSSKKGHKSKKRRHRHDSESEEEIHEKRKHRHKKHRKHKDDKAVPKLVDAYGSSESSESSFDDGIVPPPPKISRRSPSPLSPPPAPSYSSTDRVKHTSSSDRSLSVEESNKMRAKLGLKPLETKHSQSFSNNKSSDSLSIEETNHLRAQLGLKPLGSSSRYENNSGIPKETLGGVDMGDFVHKPPENISEKVASEKLKEKIAAKREKRALENKLLNVKKLAEESDSEDDVKKWVQKNRQIVSEREKAEKMAKELDQMDEVFGIGDLIEEDIRATKKTVYSSRDLKGLKVEHSVDSFLEGKEIVLTLKDKGVLDEDGDSLVNVNMLDEERYKKNIDRRKLKPDYNAYDDNEFDELGDANEKSVLQKYDEEIEGEKKTSFALGIDDNAELQAAARRQAIRAKLQQQAGKRLESLNLTALQPASDYYTEEEMNLKFKKVKKTGRKIRKPKMLKADDLLEQSTYVKQELPEEGWLRDIGSRRRPHRRNNEDMDVKPRIKNEPLDLMDTDDLPPIPEDIGNIKVEEMEQDDEDLQLALKKARKLKQVESLDTKPSIEKVAKSVIKGEERESGDEMNTGSIVLNQTAEFCRTLGDIPTYGQAGNREDAQQLLDFERELKEDLKRRDLKEDPEGGWNRVDMDETPVKIPSYETAILDAEPDLGTGVAGALKLAASKGYIEKELQNRPSASKFAHLQAQNYSIEDKTFMEDDKHSRRERYNGPTSDFREKDGYKPNIKLEYIDDEGHKLCAKEAFRYLSHKFHGKGPGKNKIEKRMKKSEQEALMKHMSSTDTPLGTLSMLQSKQKETQSPFVVLSGSKQGQSTSISKYKL